MVIGPSHLVGATHSLRRPFRCRRSSPGRRGVRSGTLVRLSQPIRRRARSAASSASGLPARRSPSSPTTACTPCSTAARRPPASPSPTGRRSWSSRTSAWSRQVFDEQTLSSLNGHIAVGHCRYSTTGSDHLGERPADVRASPTSAPASRWATTATWSTPPSCAPRSRALPGKAGRGKCSTDSDVITRLLAAAVRRHRPRGRPRWSCCPTLQGAFCLVFCDEHTLYAARDPHGVRPLVLGRLDRGWVVASETAALDIVGASFVREVEPGELLAIDADGLRSEHFAAAGAQGLRLRVRLPGPPGHHHLRPRRAGHPGRDRSPAGRRGARSRPTW